MNLLALAVLWAFLPQGTPSKILARANCQLHILCMHVHAGMGYFERGTVHKKQELK